MTVIVYLELKWHYLTFPCGTLSFTEDNFNVAEVNSKSSSRSVQTKLTELSSRGRKVSSKSIYIKDAETEKENDCLIENGST